MLLDLREIIGVPGGKVAFDYEPDMEDVPFGSITRIKKPPRAAGNVMNRAGVLTLTANVDAICECICARCLKEFQLPMHKQITAYLTEGNDDAQDSDNYFFQGDEVDIDEIINTEFLLDIDERILCSEDCAGICSKCGTDLNNGTCDCKKETDPRWEKLAELLD
jgi:uncharacterized protein